MVRTTRYSRRVMAAVAAVGAAGALVTATPAQASTGTSWSADLSTVDNDDVNVHAAAGVLTLADPAWHRTAAQTAGSEGYLLLPEHALSAPANRVTAAITDKTTAGAEVEVDVRGRTGDDWSEWQPVGTAAATFAHPATSVQVRVGLRTDADRGVSADVTGVRLTADNGPAVQAAAFTAARTYKVYATREGLVGGTTANGHVITSNDHFVSFPSGKSLSPKGTGTYSARVCRTDGSRCEYDPVWEVGPWNEKDDYWNPAASRQMWKDVAQGKPEAQAAYLNGYNGGRDDSGRTVGNPSGVDLADGTFSAGVGLSDNGYVNVTYLWTGSGPTGVITTAGDPMNVRATGHTSAAIKGLAANYAKVLIECYVQGDSVTGTFGTSKIWDRIGPNNFVSDAYVKTGSDSPVAPLC